MSNERTSSGKKPAAAQSVRRDDAAACPVPAPPGLSGVTVVALHPQPRVTDYLQGMALANAAAGAVPGYVDYGIHHGASLKVDVEDGRFVFFYRPVDL